MDGDIAEFFAALPAFVAGLLVTTEAMVAEKPEKKGPAMAGGGGMGGMGDMGGDMDF